MRASVVCAGLLLLALTLSGPLFELIPVFCPPKGSTGGQAVRVVIKYIDSRPERLHEDFLDLAAEALRTAWPCRNE
jgi:hypothetical protein